MKDSAMPRHVRAAVAISVLTASVIAAALAADSTFRGATTGTEFGERPVRGAKTDPATTIHLAFAGDVHFAGALSDLPADNESTLGAMSPVLRNADLAMVNLETAIAMDRGIADRTDKELEEPSNRYWFGTKPAALDVLARSGVDVVSVANNHGADFGLSGVNDTIAAGEDSEVAVVGIGRTERAAHTPHRVRIKGTDIAVHAADASPLESEDNIWAAAAGTGPGLASTHRGGTELLLAAVQNSAELDDLVIVYLHWGEEGSSCSTNSQEDLAQLLSEAGADIIVGSHTHTPVGSGFLGDSYVNYGLGNFFWYHGGVPDSGVLELSVHNGEVVADNWVAGQISPGGGGPNPLSGDELAAAQEDWRALRDCTNLEPGPGAPPDVADGSTDEADPDPSTDLPTFTSSISPIPRSVEIAMTSHDSATCPLGLSELRFLELSYVGFDGRWHRGEMVVNAIVAGEIVEVFRTLYQTRFPIERMLLVDEFDGDDDASMAANNTSGYNCRTVAGTANWSNHAYGLAIDINPVQNPYVVGGDIRPPAAAEFVDLDRSGETNDAPPGVIVEGDVVFEEFERIGWVWGGYYSEPDYQHFSAG